MLMSLGRTTQQRHYQVYNFTRLHHLNPLSPSSDLILVLPLTSVTRTPGLHSSLSLRLCLLQDESPGAFLAT